MSRNANESDFRSSKMGGGEACEPFGDIHSTCPWANTPILFFLLSILEIVGIFIIIRLHCSWVSRLPAGRAS